jgi:hypothetical protein
MTRIAASICLALTLLCPVLCLANTADECSAHASLDGENCEAMSIGALVEKTNIGVSSPDQYLPALDGLVSSALAVLDSASGLRLAARHREQAKPPLAAARRHALLQTFLF